MQKWLCIDCGAGIGKQSYGRCHPCALLFSKRTQIVRPEEKSERQQGDPPWRCLWCLRFRCHGPMQKCVDCHGEYLQMLGQLNAAEAAQFARENAIARGSIMAS